MASIPSTRNDDQFDMTSPMAVIGYAIRCADEATNPQAFWRFLLLARQSTKAFPDDRLNADAFYHPDPEHGGTFQTKGASFLEESPQGFDAAFFRISEKELLSLDPQHRILMENVYHALENAGIPMENAVSSNTSVFVSGFNHDHADRMNSDLETALKHKPTGSENSMISGRVSWFYDFRGPSLTIDTACSSSMVALHLARQSLISQDSEMAIVSGVNVIGFLPHILSMSYSGFLGSEGKSFTFDHRADGYARGEGVATVIMKPLASALRDGDTIRAVVRGTGLNHDGHTPGMTYPSINSQEQLIRSTYRAAGLSLDQTLYTESHGTGTQAGDFVECEAISRAFNTKSRTTPLYVGTLKPNIGHLEGGAGVAGVVKMILLLESGVISPNVNFDQINPKISKECNIQFPTKCVPWPSHSLRRTSISSFGLSGTNAHCILDDAYHYLKEQDLCGHHRTRETVPTAEELEAETAMLEKTSKIDAYDNNDLQPPVQNGDYTEGKQTFVPKDNLPSDNDNIQHVQTVPKIFIFSAFDQKALQKVLYTMRAYVQSRKLTLNNSKALSDVAYTLAERRSRFRWMSYILCNSVQELEQKLGQAPLLGNSSAPPRISFVFSGQGVQYAQMGMQLLVYPEFRQSLEDATAYFKSLGCKWSLLDELTCGSDSTRINNPEITHPACSALQIALVDLLVSWNIIPSRVVGHSSGEIAAAYCAGKLSREAAWKSAYFRGYVLSTKTVRNQSMIAVGTKEPHLLSILTQIRNRHSDGQLTIACYNSPSNYTVSGDGSMVDELQRVLDSQNIFCQKLKVQNAYHSSFMEEFSKDYEKELGAFPGKESLQNAQFPKMFSTLTGVLVKESTLNSWHWVSSMVAPVRFTEAFSNMCSDARSSPSMGSHAEEVILEIGPHSTLQSAVKEIAGTKVPIIYMASLSRQDKSLNTLLNSVGHLAVKGTPVLVHRMNQALEPLNVAEFMPELPSYPFNHDATGLYESRLTRNIRLRKFARHDLFGAPVPDWNPTNPRWRHFLRVGENPWLRDHMIQGDLVFPGAGYLVMAIEGSLQIADNKAHVVGLHLRDINFKTMLIVPDTIEGVEISLSFSPVHESKNSRSSVWKSFDIASYDDNINEWTSHCTGFVSIDYKTSPNPIDGGQEFKADCQRWKNLLRERAVACQLPVSARLFYDELARHNVKFGATFHRLTDLSISGRQLGSMVGTATVPDIKSLMPRGHIHPHLIHPTTLDSALQAAMVAVYDQNGQSLPRHGLVPTGIKSFWISMACPVEAGSSFRLSSMVSSRENGRYECSLTAWSGDDFSHRVLSIDGAQLSLLQSRSIVESVEDVQIYHTVNWQPDVYLLNNSGLAKLIRPALSRLPAYKAEQHWFSQLQLAAALLATDALSELQGLDISGLEVQYHRFHDLLKNVAADLITGSIQCVPLEAWHKLSRDPSLKQQLYDQVEAADTNGAVLMRMGTNIPAFFRKEVDPLYKMFGQDDLLAKYYEADMERGTIPAQLAEYLKLLRCSRHRLRILEIGAGTGGFTQYVLRHLAPEGTGTTIEEYVFTDLSPGFFSHAKERLGTWQETLRYKKLDIGIDPAVQDFKPGSFDIVVASNVLHATPNLQETLRRAHYLLSPGGQLLFLEGVRQETLWSNISFSALSGWWLGQEPIRKWCPYVPVTEWTKMLHQSGFSGVELEFPSSPYPEFNKVSVMVTTALSANDVNTPPDLVIFCQEEDAPKQIPQTFLAQLKLLGLNVALLSPAQHRSCDLSQTICLSLLELWVPVLSNIEVSLFENIQSILNGCQQLLWVTGDPTVEPKFDLVVGLLRTLRSEHETDRLNLISLAVEDLISDSETIVDAITRIFRKQFLRTKIPHQRNAEYRLRDAVVYTNHIRENSAATSAIASHLMEPQPCMEVWDELKRPVKLCNMRPGSLDGLYWMTDMDIMGVPLGDHELEIEIQAVGLNFRDLLAAMGLVHQAILGGEAAGIVTEVGAAVTSVQAGDRVVYLSDPSPSRVGTLRTRGRALDSLVIKIPSTLSFEIAAGLPIIHCTVLYALKHLANLVKGERILIHAAAGGVGQAAIQFAQSVGAEVFASVSSLEKKDFLITEFNIAEDHIFYSRDLTFAQGIRRMVPRGVDVILNSLSGEALQRSWSCLAPFGRFIELGKRDLQAGAHLDMTPFLQNVTISSVDLLTVSRLRPTTVQLLLQETMELFCTGQLHEARPTNVMGYSRMPDGLRLLQKGQSIGKMVLVPDAMPISVIPPSWEPYTLDPNGSYLLAGGLGGIGRSIATRLALRGAQNIIFLSRSGKITKQVQEMIAKLKEHGCASHIFQCDIANESRLNSVIMECRKTLPPIKGCIQCSVSWSDGVFHGMSHKAWQTALAPKVHGTWNLHRLFPDVDFFIMLSSVAGIVGNRGQANYNAGNTFEDALAHYRVSLGQHAASMDLGVMLSIGFMAENPDLVTHSMTVAHQHTESEMLAILDYLLDRRYPSVGSLATAQLICGLQTELSYRKRNIEPPQYLKTPLFAHLQTPSAASIPVLKSENVALELCMQNRLGAVSSRGEAVDLVLNCIQWKLARLLNTPEDHMDPTKGIRSNGVDSLMEMEFRGWLLKQLGAIISIHELTSGSVRDLSARVVAVSNLACLRSLN